MVDDLRDLGLIGDLHTVSLVNTSGSVVWTCVPRFDSDSCFASLLGSDENGHFTVAPSAKKFDSSQKYQDDTLILETVFTTSTGKVKLVDFMPIRERHARIVRIIQGVSGEVDLKIDLVLRFDYGLSVPWARRVSRGMLYASGPNSVLLESDVELEGRDMATEGNVKVSQGESHFLSLTFFGGTEEIPRRIDYQEELRKCRSFWRSWVADTEEDYEEYDPIVRRSLITLKALIYEPTGGMVAASTTSLPENVGGTRNWDYRFCWLRDASFALDAFVNRGHSAEATQWRTWLLRAVAGSPKQIQIMYGIAGERRIPELELDWLSGYRESRPVRVGNAASGQFQLDVYGEVLDAIYQMKRSGVAPDDDASAILSVFADHVREVWSEPDEGIWEIRGPRQHFTHSKIMAWVALDRAIKLELCPEDDSRMAAWKSARQDVETAVLEKGYNSDTGAFTQAFGSSQLDASVLLAPIMGFIPATDDRMLSTIEAIKSRLDHGGFVMRYETTSGSDGFNEPEGVFLPCSFWLAEDLALAGDPDGAEELLGRLIKTANPLGIFSEEFNPDTGEMVGNFAQAFTHVGLVSAVQRIIESRRGKPRDRTERDYTKYGV